MTNDEKNDHGAGLIGQPIPDIAGTEPRLSIEELATELTSETFPKVMTAIKEVRERHAEAIDALGVNRHGKIAKWAGDADDAFRDAVYQAVQSATWIALYAIRTRPEQFGSVSVYAEALLRRLREQEGR
jgi:hypothetical protein